MLRLAIIECVKCSFALRQLIVPTYRGAFARATFIGQQYAEQWSDSSNDAVMVFQPGKSGSRRGHKRGIITAATFRALAALGIELTKAEQNSLYQYWHYIAYLLGLEDSFYRDVTDHDSARELGHLFDLTIGAPDENSRALTAAMVGAQVQLLASAPQPLMPRAEFSDLIHGILRRTFG
jgi:hypothetical protein